MFFSNAMRDTIKSENPGIAFGEVRPAALGFPTFLRPVMFAWLHGAAHASKQVCYASRDAIKLI